MIIIHVAIAFNRYKLARNCTRFSKFRNIFLQKKVLVNKKNFVIDADVSSLNRFNSRR